MAESLRSFLIRDDDLVIANGELLLVDGKEEICQCVERTLTTRKREFFLNLGHGLEYEEFMKKQPNLDYIRQDIVEAVMQETRVKQVDSLNLDFDRQKRTLKVDFTFKTIDDEVLSGEVII